MTTDLLALADRLAPAFRKAFLEAVRAFQDSLSLSELRDAAAGHRIDLLQTSGSWQDFLDTLEGSLKRAVTAAVLGAGTQVIQGFPESVATQLRFDLGNPRAVDAVDTVVSQALQEIEHANVTGIAQVLQVGFNTGATPEQMARRIRGSIGLTDRDTRAVENYRQGLLDSELAPGRAEELGDQYAERLLRQRATRIARTESIRAASAGQTAAWQDAAANQLLDQNTVRRSWLVTNDDRLCPICEAIPDLNADGVPLDQPFQTDVGLVMFPPAHPLCRCAVILTHLSLV
jgi:hypothetical protein